MTDPGSHYISPSDGIVEITWHCAPLRADRFEEMWRPVAEACLEYGVLSFAFYRSTDDPWELKQVMTVADKLDFERYWYSEEVSEARSRAAGLFQVPVVPSYFHPVATGSLARSGAEA